jgi:hypothetical protein
MKRHVAQLLIAFLSGMAAAIVSGPLTWPLLELADYYLGSKAGLGFGLSGSIYLVVWGLLGVGCLELGKLVIGALWGRKG